MKLTSADRFAGFTRGMGIGGWLTNYKRFNVLPPEWRNTLTAGDFEHFESFITEEDIRRIASFGLDHVRLGFDQLVVEECPGVFRPEVMRLLTNFVDWCETHKLNVVLNLHKAIGNYCDIEEAVELTSDPELRLGFINFWVKMEEYFNDRGSIVFELLNEVRNVPPEDWNSLAAETIAALRQRNPSRRIVIGGTCASHCSTLDKLPVYADPAVIYTFHCYDPFEFTHQQGVLQPMTLYHNRRMPWPGDISLYREFKELVWNDTESYRGLARMDKEFLRQALAPAFAFQQNHPELTLWCGEFGTIRHCPLEYRENWMHDMISLLKEHGIPYCVWNYLSTPNDGNRFSLVDDDRREILSPALLAIIQGEVD